MKPNTSLLNVSRFFLSALLVLLGTALPVMAAPTVVDTSPTAGATWISEYSPVTATFSEAMDPATITSDGFTLEKRVGVVAIATGGGAGGAQTIALKGDGTVIAWGFNLYGAANVPAGLSGVTAIATGGYHTVALKGDGTVVAWGEAWNGTEAVPATAPAGLSGVVAIAVGEGHSVALKGDGTVVAWGYTWNGTAYVPVAVPTGLSGVVAIAEGGNHTVALKGDGTVVAWGYTWNGTAYAPATVPAGLTGVVAISAGYSHTVALKGDGTVIAWGDNGSGQTTVPASLSGVVAVAAGAWHTVALKDDGTVVAWGLEPISVPAGLSGVVAVAAGVNNTVALKGDGTVVDWSFFDPISVPDALSGVIAVAAAGDHTVALKGDGTVVDWVVDWNDGDSVPAGLSGVVAIAAGGDHAAALKGDGTVVAWGYTWNGTEAVPATVPAGLNGVVAIAAGGAYRSGHTVALKGDGTVIAWGDNSWGQTTVPAGLTGVVGVAAGQLHTVALKGDGTVVAWGKNDYGQTTVPVGLSGVTAITAGELHTVALKSDGTVVAWGGSNYCAQATVPVGLSGVTAITAGTNHTLALKSDGTVVAWGCSSSGAATVPVGLSGVTAIAAGRSHTLALKSDGTVVAWGDKQTGQTTVPTSPYFSSVPATVLYNGTSRTATLTPSAPLALSSVYRATVFGRSANGTPMAGSSSWKFSTGEYFASFLVTPKAGLHGKISPAIGQLAIKGTTASFTLAPDAGYVIDTVTGCSGTLAGNTYTTGPISQACTVTATFHLIPAVAPASITVPAADADGSYTVTWGSSATAGVTYVLQEASSETFTTGLRQAYAGTATSASITGRLGGKTYYYRVRAQKAGNSASAYRTADNGCVITLCATPASITVPAANTTGNYTVTWGASAPADVTYVLQEATNASFTAGLRQAYAGTGTSASITGRASGKTYYYRVRAQKPGYTTSAYRTAGNGCVIILCATPASITVPTANVTGNYTVTWGASAPADVTYVLQEATNASFTAGLRQAYAGTGTSASITGRASGKTYYYRVRAQKPGYTTSAYRTAGNGCVVTLPCPAPASITVPTANVTGSYTVTWGASALAGVTYVLQEATDAAFTAGLRQAYAGTGTSASITGRQSGKTYYYRARAQKAGYTTSIYRTASGGCRVGPP